MSGHPILIVAVNKHFSLEIQPMPQKLKVRISDAHCMYTMIKKTIGSSKVINTVALLFFLLVSADEYAFSYCDKA